MAMIARILCNTPEIWEVVRNYVWFKNCFLMEIRINQPESERHPLDPFFPEGAKVLMLGSFPPKRERWKMDFYYPNFQNDMWRIMGVVFFENKDYFLTEDKKSFCEERIRAFLAEKGIALTDTAREVIRHKDNASDKFLEVVSTIEPEDVLKQLPCCVAIVTTGQKATDTLLSAVVAEAPRVGHYCRVEISGRDMRLYRMPSSSRAYPKPLGEKACAYREMFKELGLL